MSVFTRSTVAEHAASGHGYSVKSNFGGKKVSSQSRCHAKAWLENYCVKLKKTPKKTLK